MVVLVSYAWLASTAGSASRTLLLPDCNDQLPVWHGRGNASVWPPVCTPEAADKFQFGPPPHPGVPCCAGLAPCQEKRPASYEGASVFDSVIVCRKPECCPKPAVAARPNFLFVMADDLGYGEVGAFPAGSAHGRLATPHLDRFARGAMVFTDSYAGYTVCAPSRTTLMTGYHSGSFEAHGLSGIAIPPSQDVLLLPAMLKAAGYATAAIGKAAPFTAPAASGFDHFIGQVDQDLCHNMYPRDIDVGNGTQNLNLTRNWAVPSSAAAAREACMANPHAFNYTVDITHEHALQWLRGRAGGEGAAQHTQPFFLYVAFTVPHAGGWGHAPDGWGPTDGCLPDACPEQGAPVPTDGEYAPRTAWPEVERDHAAVVTYLDGKVGELMSTLEELELEQSTLVIFASDNGAHHEGGHSNLFFNSTGGLSGHKRSLYEGGVRSPTMARWLGTVPAGVSSYRWAFWDVLPTFAELAGLEAPSGLDGVSIVPTLMGRSQPAHALLYWTWPGLGDVAPLPAGWRAEQHAAGTLVYVAPSGRAQARHPLGELESTFDDRTVAKVSGFAVVSGDWKGIVPHCADLDQRKPSAADLPSMLVFHLPSDWAEAADLARTARGRLQAQRLLGLVLEAKLSCGCYQC